MTTDVITKTPADVLDYDFEFARWLPSGDRIASATAQLGEGTTATIDHVDTSDTVARAWLTGGVAGEYSTVTVTITTVQGRIKQVSAALKIREP